MGYCCWVHCSGTKYSMTFCWLLHPCSLLTKLLVIGSSAERTVAVCHVDQLASRMCLCKFMAHCAQVASHSTNSGTRRAAHTNPHCAVRATAACKPAGTKSCCHQAQGMTTGFCCAVCGPPQHMLSWIIQDVMGSSARLACFHEQRSQQQCQHCYEYIHSMCCMHAFLA